MSGPASVARRADLLLGSSPGQLFVAGCLGPAFGDMLSGLTAPEQAREATRAAVERGEWRGLLDLDEFGLLAAVAGAHPGSCRGIVADERARALLALARQELRPVASALVSAPAARRWWEPVARADQRFLEWDGWPG